MLTILIYFHRSLHFKRQLTRQVATRNRGQQTASDGPTMSTTSSSLQERDSEIDYVHEKRSAGSQSQQCNQTESVDEKTNSTGPAGKSDNLDNGKPKNVTDISIDPMDMLDDIVDLPEYAQGHKMILTFPQKVRILNLI